VSTRASVDELATIPLFAALEASTLRELAARLTVRRWAPGEMVFDAGDASGSILAVLTGSVELERRDRAGRAWVIATRGAGEWFGDVGLIGIKRRAVGARALVESRLLEVPARELHELARRDVKAYALLTMNLARELARKVDRLEQELVERRGGSPG